VELRLLDHQVTVERQPAVGAAGLHDRRADGEIRHEVAVHDIEVKQIRARFDGRDLLSESAEVGPKQRGGDADGHCVAGGGAAGCSMIPPSSLLTTTVIGSRALTGAPRSGNWRMIVPSAMPGYASNLTVEMVRPRRSSAGRTPSSR